MLKSTLCHNTTSGMLELLKRYVKFAATSVVGSLTDTLVLWLLSDYVFADRYVGEYVISPIISFQCAVAVNFTIAYFYVWKDRTQDRRGEGKDLCFRLFLAYDLSCSAVFAVRMGVMLLIERFTGWDVVLCNLLAMCFSGILNFVIDNILVFRKK